jgi:hypothetical protein
MNGGSSSSSSGSDADDDDREGKSTSLIRKRKRIPPANIASHKRRSQGPSWKASTDRTNHAARQWNLSPFEKKATTSRPSAFGYVPGVQSSGAESSEESEYQTQSIQKRRKLIGSNSGNTSTLYTADAEPSATHAPPHTNKPTWPSADRISPIKAQWHLSDITFYSLSADVSFLTVFFRARGGSGILSASNAVKLLDNVIGQSTKLDDTAIKPLGHDAWLLTSLVSHLPDAAGHGTSQPLSAPSSLQLDRAAITRPLHNRATSSDVNDETSGDDFDDGVDEKDEYSSNVAEKPSNSRKNRRWSKEDDERLRRWKGQGKSWDWICSRFPNRSLGAVQVRWHTKLRVKAAQS